MSIRMKLLSGLGALIGFLVVQVVALWYFGNATRTQVVEAITKNTAANTKLEALAVMAQQIRRYEKEYFIYVHDLEQRTKYTKEWTAAHDKITAQLTAMDENKDRLFSSKEVGEITAWRVASDYYGDQMRRIFVFVDGAGTTLPKSTEVNGMIREGKDRFADLIKGVATVSKVKSDDTLRLATTTREGFDRLFYFVAGSTLVGVLIALSLLLRLPRAVSGPIDALTDAANAMSKGKLDAPISAQGIQEFNGLAEALDRLRAAQIAFMDRLRHKKAA